jgi:murein DD-endopeptidase MepM/ murein hydrolase activator NlpD
MKKALWVAIIVVLVIMLGAGLYIGFVKFEWEKPAIKLVSDSRYITQKLTFRVEDRKSGVAEIKLDIVQEGRAIAVLSEKYPKGTPVVEKTVSMLPLPKGLKDGDAQIRLTAWDHSWNRGNEVSLEKPVVIDTKPPQVSVLGAQHYVNVGGAGVITYTASKELAKSGVQVGDLFFPGFSIGRDRFLAYFALPHDSPRDVSFSVTGEDHPGNRVKIGFRPIIKARAFKKDDIQISDGFLKNILPYFSERDANLKGSPVEIFLYLNRKQREIDHQQIKKICQETTPQPLWSGTFLRLPNAKPMASFAQDRTYFYNGKEIDRQTHLGVDLASLGQSPVPAANAGKIAFAGPLGIYGNTVVIDHGCGLFSMYSHLSSIEAEAKKEVKRGEAIGRSGTTGMAGGDHLHYAMMIHGVFINPIEWWDEHWIKDNIELKMKLFDAPAQPAAQVKEAEPKSSAAKQGRAKRSSRR